VQQALDKGDLQAAQTAIDAMRSSMGRGRTGGQGGGQAPGGGN
jgi:hypothetical protein